MPQFKRSVQVRLKGHAAPLMLVAGHVHNRVTYPKGTRVVCVWIDKYHRPHQVAYHASLLERVTPLPERESSENHLG